MRCNTDPDHGSAAASMWIRIQTQVRIQGVKNRPEKKIETNLTTKLLDTVFCLFQRLFSIFNLENVNFILCIIQNLGYLFWGFSTFSGTILEIFAS